MSKQTSKLEYGVAATAITISSRTKETEPPKLTVVTVKLETAAYERCCLCNRRTMLPFCLEYLDSEGNADKITAERREVL